MIRGTNPTLTLTVGPDTLDLEQADAVYVTIKRGATTVTKSGEDISVDGNVVSCWLTEAESLSVSEGAASIQVNWTYTENGEERRAASVVVGINIGRQLLLEELTGGE